MMRTVLNGLAWIILVVVFGAVLVAIGVMVYASFTNIDTRLYTCVMLGLIFTIWAILWALKRVTQP